jgi:hypothetical protein
MGEPKIGYRTRYSLTKGLIEALEYTPTPSDSTFVVIRLPGCFDQYHRIGKDFFLTESEALADVEKRRLAKIRSLKKSLAKLEKLKVSFALPKFSR